MTMRMMWKTYTTGIQAAGNSDEYWAPALVLLLEARNMLLLLFFQLLLLLFLMLVMSLLPMLLPLLAPPFPSFVRPRETKRKGAEIERVHLERMQHPRRRSMTRLATTPLMIGRRQHLAQVTVIDTAQLPDI